MRDELKDNLKTKSFFIGISLGSNTNYDSSFAVLDKDLNIISIDKFYTVEDLELILKNFTSSDNAIFCVSMPEDMTLLDGKWRIHAKNYKMLDDTFKINRHNWTNRISMRANDLLLQYKNKGTIIYRYDVAQLRMSYGLEPIFPIRSSSDCKSFQDSLRLKYNFRLLPDNMLPASNLEALLGALFAYDISKGIEINNVCEIGGLDVLFKVI